MGQAQSNRQRRVQYTDVELWELYGDSDGRDYGGRRKNRRENGREDYDRRRSTGSEQIRSRYTDRGEGKRREGRNRTVYDIRENHICAENSRRRGNHTRNNRTADRDLNIMLYGENRSGSGRVSSGRTGNGRSQSRRELQIQDISRRRGAESGLNTGSQTVYMGSARPVQSLRRRQIRKRKVYLARTFAVTMVALCLVLIYVMTGQIYRLIHERTDQGQLPVFLEKIPKEQEGPAVVPPVVTQDFLEVNDFSRPGTELKKIKSIFVHYTANPGTSAAQNRSYFANLALTQERSASAHLIIGYEGEIIQCIPFDEQAYAVMTRNEDSISIECCYVDEDGSFTQETYDSLIHTLAWLTDQYDLSTEDILRHYDCGGKKCPIYYVEHEDAWDRLLQDVEAYQQTAREDL